MNECPENEFLRLDCLEKALSQNSSDEAPRRTWSRPKSDKMSICRLSTKLFTPVVLYFYNVGFIM